MAEQTREEIEHLLTGTAFNGDAHPSWWQCSCGALGEVRPGPRWMVRRSWALHRSACEAWVVRRRKLATLEHGPGGVE